MNMVVIHFVLSLTVLSTITVAQVEFSFEESGYNDGDSVKLIAKYTGGGTEHYVNWYYSKQVSGDNVVDIQSSCSLFAVADAGYPPMTYTCDTNTHTYTATITSVPSSAFGKEWGASFRLSNGTTTAVVKNTLQRKIVTGNMIDFL